MSNPHAHLHAIPFNTEFKNGYIARTAVSSLVLFELCEVLVTSSLERRPFLSMALQVAWLRHDIIPLRKLICSSCQKTKNKIYFNEMEKLRVSEAFARMHTIMYCASAHARANQATLHNKATSYSQWLLLWIKWIAGKRWWETKSYSWLLFKVLVDLIIVIMSSIACCDIFASVTFFLLLGCFPIINIKNYTAIVR